MEPNRIVAIVDDDAITRMMLERIVETAGMVPISFETPDAFLDYMGTNSPACVLLDMNMPEMCGVDVQCKLNEMGVTVPVIMVTAESDVPTARAALANGAVAFLAKPIDPQELLSRIREIFGTVSVDWN